MQPIIENKEQLIIADLQRDIKVCGLPLKDPGTTRLKTQGAHDPTPTPYFVLEELFEGIEFTPQSHLLDVGCGTGRVLAFHKSARIPGRATGIELDPDLAKCAQEWTRRYATIGAKQGDALDLPLGDFTHFYLFNPFDTNVLLKFLACIEAQVNHAVRLIHMSDNGETYFYMGRPGWTLVRQGEFHKYRNARGRAFDVYEHPQHYSIWRYEP